MTYTFKNETTAFDFWKLSMYHTYHSMAGICNVIFTVAMILLTVKFLPTANSMFGVLLLFACCLFPVIQPIGIYMRAKNQIAVLPRNMEMQFDEKGIHISTLEEKKTVHWNKIRHVKEEPNMIILMENNSRGYMIPNRVLGTKKGEFLSFVKNRIQYK